MTMEKHNCQYISLPDTLEHKLNLLSLSLTKAKALTLVGMETDFSEYEETLCSDYWDNVFGLLEDISDLKNDISEVIKKLI